MGGSGDAQRKINQRCANCTRNGVENMEHTENENKAAGAPSALNVGLEVFARPLPHGAIVEYCGERGMVLNDDGGDRIEVACDGHRQNWHWTFEGVSCTVISMTSNVKLTGSALLRSPR